MAVKIRLKKMGSKKRPFYRVVAADSRFPRDGRFLEIVGYYNPMLEPAEIKIDEDKLYKWLDDGAKPTGNAANVLKEAGLLERWRLLRAGVKIAELDATIEERRAKQPSPKPRKRKLSKKAQAAKAAEEKAAEEKAVEEKKSAEKKPAEEKAVEDKAVEEKKSAEKKPAEEKAVEEKAVEEKKPAGGENAPAETAAPKEKVTKEEAAPEEKAGESGEAAGEEKPDVKDSGQEKTEG